MFDLKANTKISKSGWFRALKSSAKVPGISLHAKQCLIIAGNIKIDGMVFLLANDYYPGIRSYYYILLQNNYFEYAKHTHPSPDRYTFA
jgi:hypothetical protein